MRPEEDWEASEALAANGGRLHPGTVRQLHRHRYQAAEREHHASEGIADLLDDIAPLHLVEIAVLGKASQLPGGQRGENPVRGQALEVVCSQSAPITAMALETQRHI